MKPAISNSDFFSPLSGGPYGKAITELQGTVDEIRTTNGVAGLTLDAGVGGFFFDLTAVSYPIAVTNC